METVGFFFPADILLDDGCEGNLRKEGRSVRIVVTIHSGSNKTKVTVKYPVDIGVLVSGHTYWPPELCVTVFDSLHW